MYIERVPNRNSPPAILLRESYREGKKVRKRTLANLSKLPPECIEVLSLELKGAKLVPAGHVFDIERSIPHGHARAVLGTIRNIGLDKLIAPRRSRMRDMAVAMIADRLIHGCSKLAETRRWPDTTLAEELSLQDATEDDLYAAMDWLLKRQRRIEKRLARLHLCEGSRALYDVSSSYYEGRTCKLARFGHNRDAKKGKRIIVYGILADREGRPISTDVYPGNTSDSTTVPDQADKLCGRFGLERVVLVGDRGMLTEVQIDKLKRHPGLGWISALRSTAIRRLVEEGKVERSLFDRRNLAEIASPQFPGERLVACFNPLLAAERARKREKLLTATEEKLEKIRKEAARRKRKPLSKAEIGVKVGKVINRYKMGKHFRLTIEDGRFEYDRREENISREKTLDGIYIIRTSESGDSLSAEDTVRAYKDLCRIEQAFRRYKGIDIRVRPIRHREEDRVRAHILLCMFAYYVEWHMRRALAPLLFDDEELKDQRGTRDPVAPAQPSESAKKKKSTRRTDNDLPISSFDSLLAHLATLCRNHCRIRMQKSEIACKMDTRPTPLQSRAFELLDV